MKRIGTYEVGGSYTMESKSKDILKPYDRWDER